MNGTFIDALKAIGDALITIIESDVPESVISIFDDISMDIVDVVRDIIELFVN